MFVSCMSWHALHTIWSLMWADYSKQKTKPRKTTAAKDTYSTIEMWQRQINILCVVRQNCADLKVRASLDAGRRFEGKDRLQAVDTVLDIWWVGRTKMFCQTQQSSVPCIRLLLCYRRRHCHDSVASYNTIHRHI